MLERLWRRALTRLQYSSSYDWLSSKIAERSGRPSVFFFAMHRGGSTIISRLLIRAGNLKHVDYASMIFNGQNPRINFKQFGHLYGPIRMSQHSTPDNAVEGLGLDEKISILKDARSIILIRDPRDILISRYYYFGWSHPLSVAADIRERQLALMDSIQSMTVDQYVIENSEYQNAYFLQVERILNLREDSILVRYSDLVDNFDHFWAGLEKAIEFSPDAKDWFFQETRPRAVEITSSHKRSGKVGGFRTHLKPDTIKQANVILKPTLERFAFEA